MSETQRRKLSYYFASRKQRGEEGLPVLSVTMRSGLMPRDEIGRKADSSLTAAEHLLVEPGDIAYNMMRMWQGALGLAERRANVSPAYGVMRPKETVDPRFSAHWFKSDRGLYMLWAYSYGLTDDRLRLYPDEFLQIPVEWPDLAAQRQIAAVLDTWDDAINIVARMAAAKQRRGDALRSQLIAGTPTCLTNAADVRFSGVDKKIGEREQAVRLCNYLHVWRNKRLDSSILFDSGSASPGEIASFSLREGDFVFTKDSETPDEIAEVAYVAETMPEVVCGYHLALGRPRPSYVGSYLAQALRLPHVRNEFAKRSNGAIRFGLTLDTLDQIRIPVPSESDQMKVAKVLGAADEEVRHCRDLLELLRRQKRGLMQKLFASECRVPKSIGQLTLGGGKDECEKVAAA